MNRQKHVNAGCCYHGCRLGLIEGCPAEDEECDCGIESRQPVSSKMLPVRIREPEPRLIKRFGIFNNDRKRSR